ncbi:outer membrane beta-barrel protein [Helicobacter cetorum]|uniref:outer membrane beta-barrel protein n=1 Tax=Helicobacter cetorum TaxID=138563 RepID=UPI000CF064BB|nr:outer membrane beta-barrel protein [Helicobacter cetorum]
MKNNNFKLKSFIGVVSILVAYNLYAEEDGWYASVGYQIGESQQQIKGLKSFAEPKIKELENRIKAQETPLGDIQNSIQALDQQISSKQGEIDTKNKNISDLQNQINQYQTAIDSQNKEIANKQAEIESIKNQITGINAQIEDQKATISAQENQIQSQKTQIAEQEKLIQTQTATKEQQQTALNQLNAEIEKLQNQITEKEQNIAQSQNTIDNLNAQITTLNQQAQETKGNLVTATEGIFSNVAPQFFGQGQNSIQNAASATLTMAQNLIGFLGSNGNLTGWSGMGQVGSSISTTKGIDILRKSEVVIPGSTRKGGPFAGYAITNKDNENILTIGNRSIAMPLFNICNTAGDCPMDKTNATSKQLNEDSTVLDVVVSALQYQAAYAPTYGSKKNVNGQLVSHDYVTQQELDSPNGFSMQNAQLANSMTEAEFKNKLPDIINKVGYDAQIALNSVKGGVEMLGFMIKVAKEGDMTDEQAQQILFNDSKTTNGSQIQQQLEPYIKQGLAKLAQSPLDNDNPLLKLAEAMVNTQTKINENNSQIANDLNGIVNLDTRGKGNGNPFNLNQFGSDRSFKSVSSYTDKLTGDEYQKFVEATNQTQSTLNDLKGKVTEISSKQEQLNTEKSTQQDTQNKLVQSKNELDGQLSAQQTQQETLANQTQELNNSIDRLNTQNQELTQSNENLTQQNEKLNQSNQELTQKTATLGTSEEQARKLLENLNQQVASQDKLQDKAQAEQDSVKADKALIVKAQNELQSTKNALVNQEKQIYQSTAKDRQYLSVLQKAASSNSRIANGAMNGVGFNIGYKQFFTKKRNIGMRYYGFVDYNHTYIKGLLLSSASDVWTYGVGSDFLWNFINSKSWGLGCKNSKVCAKWNVGTFSGIQLAGTTWLSNINNSLDSLMGKSNFKNSNFQFLFNLGLRLNVEVAKSQSHGVELGVKIPTINTNYYSKDSTSVSLRRLYSVFLNYTYGF